MLGLFSNSLHNDLNTRKSHCVNRNVYFIGLHCSCLCRLYLHYRFRCDIHTIPHFYLNPSMRFHTNKDCNCEQSCFSWYKFKRWYINVINIHRRHSKQSVHYQRLEYLRRNFHLQFFVHEHSQLIDDFYCDLQFQSRSRKSLSNHYHSGQWINYVFFWN